MRKKVSFDNGVTNQTYVNGASAGDSDDGDRYIGDVELVAKDDERRRTRREWQLIVATWLVGAMVLTITATVCLTGNCGSGKREHPTCERLRGNTQTVTY